MDTEKIEKQPVLVDRIGIFEDGSGYIYLQCGERIRKLSFSGGSFEKRDTTAGKIITVVPEKTELDTLFGKNGDSYFLRGKDMYPEKWGVFDLFGMRVGIVGTGVDVEVFPRIED